MAPEAIRAIDHNIFTPGNYFYNGVGHVTVKYWEVLEIGYEGIMAKAQAELDKCNVGDGDYAERSRFLEAVIMSCQAVIDYADRYAKLALEMAEKCTDPQRKAELLVIASNCSKVPAKGATNSGRRVSPSGLCSSFCRLSPADIRSHREDLTSTCILISEGHGERQDHKRVCAGTDGLYLGKTQ